MSINTRSVYCLLFFLGLSISQPLAAEIYRWVDADGNVHFDERARNSDAQKIEIRSRAPADPELAKRLKKRDKLLQVIGDEREEKQQLKEKQVKEKQQRKARCKAAKKRLLEYQQARGIYTKDEKGNKTFLDKKARASTIAKTEAAVKTACK